jgi:hypothetical protein
MAFRAVPDVDRFDELFAAIGIQRNQRTILDEKDGAPSRKRLLSGLSANTLQGSPKLLVGKLHIFHNVIAHGSVSPCAVILSW